MKTAGLLMRDSIHRWQQRKVLVTYENFLKLFLWSTYKFLRTTGFVLQGRPQFIALNYCILRNDFVLLRMIFSKQARKALFYWSHGYKNARFRELA